MTDQVATPEAPAGKDFRHFGHARAATRGERILYGGIRVILVAWARLWFRLEIRGREHVPASGPFILTPSHRSNIDFLLVLVCAKRRMRFLAKDSLWKAPFDRLWTALGGIPVHRGSADRDALRTCVEVIKAGEPLVVFPEGARQTGPVLTPLFDGPAFIQSRTGAPIVPVGIGGSERAMPKGAKWIRPSKVTVVVGPPLPAMETDGPKARRAGIHDRTAELTPVIQDLFDDAQAWAGTPNASRESLREVPGTSRNG